MDRFYRLFDIIFDGSGEDPKVSHAQIHEIGVQAVEKALAPKPEEPKSAERVVAAQNDNERQLTTVD